MSLGWATDQENPNLEAAPNLDSTDGSDVPMHLDADLSVLKYVDNPTPSTGSNITYTVMVTNGGPNNAIDVQISDVLPLGVVYQSHSPTQENYNNVSGLWSVGDLADGASATLNITAQVTAVGPATVTNTATVINLNQPDPNLENNSDPASIYVGEPAPDEADLVILKFADNHRPYEGTTITFTVMVENTGPVNATNIQVIDQLPNDVTYQSHSTTAGTYNSSTGIWSIPSLGNGGIATLTIAAIVNAGTAGSTFPNTATITALDQTDPYLGNNWVEAEFFPLEAPPRAPARGVPIFPNVYIGIGATLVAGVLACLLRKRLIRQVL